MRVWKLEGIRNPSASCGCRRETIDSLHAARRPCARYFTVADVVGTRAALAGSGLPSPSIRVNCLLRRVERVIDFAHMVQQRLYGNRQVRQSESPMEPFNTKMNQPAQYYGQISTSIFQNCQAKSPRHRGLRLWARSIMRRIPARVGLAKSSCTLVKAGLWNLRLRRTGGRPSGPETTSLQGMEPLTLSRVRRWSKSAALPSPRRINVADLYK
jgi:hypothetical protein